MEDVIKKYNSTKKIKNIFILITSLSLALWLNLFFSNTDMWNYIKSSVLDTWNLNKDIWELYLENNTLWWNNIINVLNSKQLNNVQTLSFSIMYNPENIEIKDEIINIKNADFVKLWKLNNWFYSLIINFEENTTINKGENIFSFIINKKTSEQENINLINANFEDTEIKYSLTTSWIEF